MDVFAKGLLNAAQIKESGRLAGMVEARYASWKTESFAQSVVAGTSSFDALEKVAVEKGHPKKSSGKQGIFTSFESLFYIVFVIHKKCGASCRTL
jgi:xylose isomerase